MPDHWVVPVPDPHLIDFTERTHPISTGSGVIFVIQVESAGVGHLVI
jgi:hypothetical protein